LPPTRGNERSHIDQHAIAFVDVHVLFLAGHRHSDSRITGRCDTW
jgi:hypothetical protein